ncbi:LysR family transcriptional regulator [Bradyrhizobium manausense]|uniref:LysR substrate-binding domain-containing protein n=1 Tax=Bradyrhizobium manausense TaxID=989370 RepID=UPI001BABB150|nr:LysR substrate-binding domain-containing protein [Bradyrhizobium manausense]MBR0828639.1 LysR family transcriptional regulator [Bradyrhizobium manausense]
MELRHLRYFVAVAEELHFGRAALRLHISQPPLSAQIAALEEEIGAQLLDRDRRHVKLTEAGRRFLQEARATLEQAERARDVARRAQNGELGEIRIGLYGSAPLTRGVSEALAGFRAEFPGIALLLHDLDSAQQIEHLQSRALDVGFIRQHRPPALSAPFECFEVVREALQVLLPIGHALASEDTPLAIDRLANEPFVFLARSLRSMLHEQIYSICAASGFVPKVTQEATSNAMVLGLVAAGFGLSILPSASCRMGSGRIVTRPLDAPNRMTSCWLIHSGETARPLVRHFADFVRKRGLSIEPDPS